MIVMARAGAVLLAAAALVSFGAQYFADRDARAQAAAGEAVIDSFMASRFSDDRLRQIAADPRRTGEFLALVEGSCEHRALRAECVSFTRSGVMGRWSTIRAQAQVSELEQ